MDDLRQQIKEHHSKIAKLEEKLESKANELQQLKQQMIGKEAIDLKIELAGVKATLNERNKQAEEFKIQTDEWKQKEKEWLKMFGQVYNLSKDPGFYKDLKKALEEF